MPELVDARLRELLREKGKALFSGRIDVVVGGLGGVIHWSEGQVLDVRLGTTTGEPALWRMLLADRARVAVDAGKPRATGGAVLGKPEALLARFAERLLVLDRTAEKVGGLERVWAIRFDALARVLDELPDAINPVVRLLDGRRPVRLVVAECGLDDMLALRILQKLLVQGLLTLPENDSALPQPAAAPQGELVDEGLEAALAASLAEIEAEDAQRATDPSDEGDEGDARAPIPLVQRAAPAAGSDAPRDAMPPPVTTAGTGGPEASRERWALPSAPRPTTHDELRSWLGNEEQFFNDARSRPPAEVVVPGPPPRAGLGVVPMALMFLLAVGLGALIARLL